MRALHWACLVPRALKQRLWRVTNSESSTEEVIYTSQEMKNMSADIAIKDIMGSDNDNKETSVIIENSNYGKLLSITSKS